MFWIVEDPSMRSLVVEMVEVQIDEERKVRTLSRQANPLVGLDQSESRQLHEADESGGSSKLQRRTSFAGQFVARL
jgi:hypothetical protein